MKVLCPSCERLVELVDLRIERGELVARCPACGAEQRQHLPARPVTVPSARPGAAAAPARPAAQDEEDDEGPTIILLTPGSDQIPLAVAPPGTPDVARPATVARFEPPKPVVDAEFAKLLSQLGDVHPPAPPPRPRNTGAHAAVGASAVVPPLPQAGVARGSTIQIPPGHCPKCISPRTREALICPACGLVFANFRAEEHQPSAALESAWRGLEERWTRADEHEKFLQLAFNLDELARAGRLYRIRLATMPDDAASKAALESMVRMASTAASLAARTDPAELARQRRKVLAVSAMLFFVLPIAALLVNLLLRAH